MTKISVIGSGTMGHGIAQVAAMAGYDVAITDTTAAALDRAQSNVAGNLAGAVERGKATQEVADAALARITFTGDRNAAVENAQLVIEAIIEDIDVKRSLFAELDSQADPSAILASNTSSLSIGQIAEVTERPDKVVGMHFFNPVHIMKLVEIVSHADTSPETLATVREVAEHMGKTAISVKDTPGFATSRLGVVLGLEAMRMVEQGVASPEDIDKAMELGYGHPMGPRRVSDLAGLDIRLAIAEHLFSEFHSTQYQPPQILKDKVSSGELGKKTGKGFYVWPKQ